MRNFSLLTLLFFLLCSVALAAAQGSDNKTSSSWQTLNGDAPLVIARGGFSGIFPDSSSDAYTYALDKGLPNSILWCDVQLTKDGAGICSPDLDLQNSSIIWYYRPNQSNTYNVNGVLMRGWFSVDFTLNDLASIILAQGVFSRTIWFNYNPYQFLTVQDVALQFKPPGLWLNIQHDAFFTQHNLSMRSYVTSVSSIIMVNYISSPEVNFLKSIYAHFKPSTTKLVLRLLQPDDIDPSTNQTYGSLLRNLTFVKTFASGILVPKTYIWPVDESLYLQPHTSIVLDAHKEGLEVFASEFVNDLQLSYNYSYDPVAEILSFIDNGNFSVDGVLSDFPITPSEAIGCFSHIGKNDSGQASPLVISYNGASGDYPGCTDLAYMKAISDGVDVLDCSVQMTKDGIPICLGSINLIDSTTAAESSFSNYTIIIPDLKSDRAIFTFNLTWEEIQSLRPVISSPFSEQGFQRNPKFRNSGKFLSLPNFLALAKNTSSLSGVLISIENAAYFAENQAISITDVVLDALGKAGFDNQTATKVMIQSTNSSVLKEFRAKINYELVYVIDELIRDIVNSTIEDIKSFADSVVIAKSCIFPERMAYIAGITDVVTKLHAFKLPVYVQLFSNEFASQAWDFSSDATVEINSYVMGAGIDGIITDFPKTAASYKKNTCLKMGNKTPPYMQPVRPGGLMEMIQTKFAPAESPYPVLMDSDVSEPPLPSAAEKPRNASAALAPSPSNGQPQIAACDISLAVTMLITISLLVCKFL